MASSQPERGWLPRAKLRERPAQAEAEVIAEACDSGVGLVLLTLTLVGHQRDDDRA